MQVVIEVGHPLSGDGLRLKHHGGLQGAGFDRVAFIVAAIDTDHHHVVAIRRFQCGNGAEGDGTVAANHAFNVRMSLQDAVHNAFAVD